MIELAFLMPNEGRLVKTIGSPFTLGMPINFQ